MLYGAGNNLFVCLYICVTRSAPELLQAGSASLFLGPSDGLHSHSLLLDEERGRLLLGARDHIYLLDPDNLARAPRKVHYAAKGTAGMCRTGEHRMEKTRPRMSFVR